MLWAWLSMAFRKAWLVGGRGISRGKPQAPSLGGLACLHACLISWLLVPVVCVWCVHVMRGRPWSMPVTPAWPGSNGPLFPDPREMPPSLSQSLISFHPAWMVMGIGRSAWPVSSGPEGVASGPGPAWMDSGSPLSSCSGGLGRAPRATQEPSATPHHPHSCYANVTAQELQHRRGGSPGPRLPAHQQQWVG